jgi:hypothetical protein
MRGRRFLGWAVGLLAGLAAGCNSMIAGQWRSIEPSEGSAEAARLRQVEFNKDGQFQGRMIRSGRTIRVTGTYQFDGWKLVLAPDGSAAGGSQAYRVRLIGDVLLLARGNVTTRLCRELPNTPPPVAPAVSEGIGPAAVAPASAPDSKSAPPP